MSTAELDADFDTGTSGASLTYPMQCSALKKGGFVMIKERPCKIVEMSTSKTGKHGHAKVHLVALDIFTQKKYEDLCPSTHNMSVPVTNRKDFQVVDISDDGYLNLMDDDGTTKEDLKVPEGEVGDDVRAKFEAGESFLVTVLSACNEEMVVGTKVLTG
ncbi:eukaryotic translation initiation factor 5A [Hydra vulgaris]|uniref:Eukaryotic translation initiation factor 5A n=1 Tax=Hydra vulgaris TaxID=6087 RepID=A0ABM4C3F8_HYDVU